MSSELDKQLAEAEEDLDRISQNFPANWEVPKSPIPPAPEAAQSEAALSTEQSTDSVTEPAAEAKPESATPEQTVPDPTDLLASIKLRRPVPHGVARD